MTNFAELALPDPLLRALDSLGYTEPTAVQAAALPELLAGNDVQAQARTGSGKTAAFGLGLLAALDPAQTRLQALVLCPTRELADQVANAIRGLARHLPNIKVLSLCGGIPLRAQLASLTHEPHVAVGMPGRLQDLLKRGALDTEALRVVVLDEADRMLDMGFIDPIRAILRRTPPSRRTWMFSATYPDAIRSLGAEFQRDAQTITVDDTHPTGTIRQRLIRAERAEKPALLMRLLLREAPAACLVFCNTRRDVADVADQLRSRGVTALALHGELDQRERDETLVQFANGSCRVLVTTDVAARGLDIESLPMVVCWELAPDPDVHLHRIGRTGRAGETGDAVSLVSAREQPRLVGIEARLTKPLGWFEPPPEPNGARPEPARMRTLVIDGGRRDKLRRGDILGALTGDGGLSGGEVGRIDLFATRAYVAIAAPRYRAVLSALRDARIKNRRFRLRGL